MDPLGHAGVLDLLIFKGVILKKRHYGAFFNEIEN